MESQDHDSDDEIVKAMKWIVILTAAFIATCYAFASVLCFMRDNYILASVYAIGATVIALAPVFCFIYLRRVQS